jgi:hypothetical protein
VREKDSAIGTINATLILTNEVPGKARR